MPKKRKRGSSITRSKKLKHPQSGSFSAHSAELDFYKLFYETLNKIPISLPDQFIFFWSLEHKRYVCKEQSLLLARGLINKKDLEYTMDKIHNVEFLDPENRLARGIYVIIYTLLLIPALLLFAAAFVAIDAEKIGLSIEILILISALCLVSSAVVYFSCYISPAQHRKKMHLRCKKLLEVLNELNSAYLGRTNAFWKSGPCGAYLVYYPNFSARVKAGESAVVAVDNTDRAKKPCLRPAGTVFGSKEARRMLLQRIKNKTITALRLKQTLKKSGLSHESSFINRFYDKESGSAMFNSSVSDFSDLKNSPRRAVRQTRLPDLKQVNEEALGHGGDEDEEEVSSARKVLKVNNSPFVNKDDFEETSKVRGPEEGSKGLIEAVKDPKIAPIEDSGEKNPFDEELGNQRIQPRKALSLIVKTPEKVEGKAMSSLKALDGDITDRIHTASSFENKHNLDKKGEKIEENEHIDRPKEHSSPIKQPEAQESQNKAILEVVEEEPS